MPPHDLLPGLDDLAEQLATKVVEQLQGGVQQRYLSVSDASVYTGLSGDSIRSLLAGGKLTGLRPVPGRVLIDRRELDAFILSSTKAPRKGRGIRREGGDH